MQSPALTINAPSYPRYWKESMEASLLSISSGYGAYRYWVEKSRTKVVNESCPGELRLFSMDSKKDCSTEVIYLHDCTYRSAAKPT
jgi:hypothetical protein